jgi:hypothetical protein
MKISVFVSYILVVGAIFFTFALIVTDVNNSYPEADINKSEWEDEYDYVSDLNSTISPLEEKFKVIQDENAGFFTKIGAGITAIPYAIIIFPQIVFGSLEIGGKMTTGFLAVLAIPGYLVIVVIISTLIWALFKLVEFFQKQSVGKL